MGFFRGGISIILILGICCFFWGKQIDSETDDANTRLAAWSKRYISPLNKHDYALVRNTIYDLLNNELITNITKLPPELLRRDKNGRLI